MEETKIEYPIINSKSSEGFYHGGKTNKVFQVVRNCSKLRNKKSLPRYQHPLRDAYQIDPIYLNLK